MDICVFTYGLHDITTGAPVGLDKLCRLGAGYPALDETTIKYYHGNTTPQIITRTLLEYGAFGNVVKSYNDGDVAYPDDNTVTEITYHQDM
ncbi:MAG: hypothetical protein LBL18_00530, partial [Bacteroidales bacterium]|nr:hypothetical protein [Bacteroidales bacterium]